MSITLHHNDLPADIDWGDMVAVDTETMGLNPNRDRLCLVQLSTGDGTAHLVQIPEKADSPNLLALMTDPRVLKLFHYARFDMAIMQATYGIAVGPVYCTKIASKLCRTYTDKHSLKELCRELAEVDLSKQQQSSNWGAETLTEAQLKYAASDVLYLHTLKDKLDAMLAKNGRAALAQSCFDFLATRVALDLEGWPEDDLFAH